MAGIEIQRDSETQEYRLYDPGTTAEGPIVAIGEPAALVSDGRVYMSKDGTSVKEVVKTVPALASVVEVEFPDDEDGEDGEGGGDGDADADGDEECDECDHSESEHDDNGCNVDGCDCGGFVEPAADAADAAEPV